MTAPSHAPTTHALRRAREHRERAALLQAEARDKSTPKRRAAALRHMALLHMMAAQDLAL